MKITRKILQLVLLLVLAATTFTCKKDIVSSKETGAFSLSFEDAGLKSDINLTDVYVSIASAKGEIIYDMKRLPLLHFTDGYVTETLELKEGDYIITAFMVASDNDIVYLTPRNDSPKAYLVSRPLPIEFSIQANRTTKIVPEVVKIDNCNCPPEDFGYVSFSFTIVEEDPFTYNLTGTWEMCTEIIDENGTASKECIYVEISQDENYIQVISFDEEKYLYGKINGNELVLEDSLTGQILFLTIADENKIHTIAEDCMGGCTFIVFYRIPLPTESCFNFEIPDIDGLDAYLTVYGNGSREIASVQVYSGINTVSFENIYEYYIIKVSSPQVKCFSNNGYYLSADELEKFSCMQSIDPGYPLQICGGEPIDVLFPENDSIVEK